MLLLKREYANNSNNKEIYDSQYKKLDVKDDLYIGAACLLEIRKVEKKRWAPRKDGEEVIIQDNEYQWLTLFPKEENFSILAIYNVKSELVQFTFNIGKNIQYKGKNPYLDDLYLDIALTSENEVIFIGEDELENVYKSGNLKHQDYEIARKAADKILHKFHKQSGFDELKKTADKYLDILKNRVD